MKYDKTVNEKIGQLKTGIKNARECDEDVKLARTILPEDTYFWVDYEVNASFKAKSFDEIKDYLGRFAKIGVMLDRYVKSESAPIWYLKGRKVSIRLLPQWLMEGEAKAQGASCHLVKVGEAVSTYTKYKLICDGKVVGDHETESATVTE